MLSVLIPGDRFKPEADNSHDSGVHVREAHVGEVQPLVEVEHLRGLVTYHLLLAGPGSRNDILVKIIGSRSREADLLELAGTVS